ncbi:MAG: HAD family hydrolase [Phycisphaerae bacterium]|nr:HAD family hydrolase [Phycisphaerae bacterium]
MAVERLRGLRAVVFDLDDTLYSERSFAFSGFEAVAAWLSARWPCRFDPAVRMKELFETDSRPRVFNELLRELGCPHGEEWVPAMVECYRTHRPGIVLHPDAEAALSRWGGCVPLGLISDGPEAVQRRKVEALGLATRIEHIILTDQWGPAFWKPHPRAFGIMQERLGCAGLACVYIGDNPGKDFLAPRRLGWQTVQVCRSGGLYGQVQAPEGGEPACRVSSLDELELSFA